MLQGLFGFGGRKIKAALAKGATIIDVRTVHEYDQGRIRGSINIPLDRITASIQRIRNFNTPVVICGNGDRRSDEATRFLKQNGIEEVFNGGSWERVLKIIHNI